MNDELTTLDIATLIYFIDDEIEARRRRLLEIEEEDTIEYKLIVESARQGIEMFQELRKKLMARFKEEDDTNNNQRTITIDPNKFKIQRLSKGFSIRELERSSGVSRKTIIKHEQTECNTDEYIVAKLANALECEIEDLTA